MLTNDYNRKSLTVYKASAGSGKTFTLSIEYIKLLILNPSSYRATLAVTFTNKATEEMKSRILSQLYGIWKSLPDSRGYIDKITHDLGITESLMSERAGMALHNIVNNYSYFRIETIDSFFQSVLRNLARELDLTANLKIELNDYQIERKAVDEMIEHLGGSDDILKWIMDYIRESIDEEKNWNVIGQIKKFGENIFREYYKSSSAMLNDALSQKGFFGKFVHRLKEMRDSSEKAIIDAADDFFDAMDQNGLDIRDLKNGTRGVAGYFIKLRKGTFDESVVNTTVRKALDEGGADKWVKKSAPEDLCRFAEHTLSPILDNTENTRICNWRTYQSAVLTLRNINQLRLLNSIEKKVREMNAQSNSFLLSDTHTLLHSLIHGSDTPFIFEKIGSRLDNIMIDEFQDTSTIQWQNFKILLEECMSHGERQGNLIVGDVKQSIYRWRSGDWRMLNNIEHEFGYLRDLVGICTLDTNYRSQKKVVEFNNAFFTQAAAIEYGKLREAPASAAAVARAEELRKAYADVCQKVPASRQDAGYVRIELVPSDNAQEEILQRTVGKVEELLSLGASTSDIAILLRSNETIRMVAEYFSQAMPDVKLVSNDAFRLDSSKRINIIMKALRHLYHPDDTASLAYIVKSYALNILHYTAEQTNALMARGCECIEDTLPEAYTEHKAELKAMPIFDLVERLYKLFGLEAIDGEDAYMFEFFDSLGNFISTKTADADDFIDEWDSNLCSKTIQANSTDGIQLITIHKSKGLEFEHVIIPFCDWRLEQGGIIWCTPQEEPFNELPLVPVSFNAKQMKGTIYEEDYNEEHLQNIVDNLNLLYVAFTRASASLTVIAQHGSELTRSFLIEQAITDMPLEGCLFEGDPSDRKSELAITYGKLECKKEAQKDVSQNIFLPIVERIDAELKTFDSNVEYRQSNKSQDFVISPDDEEALKQQSYIKTGRVLHKMFSSVKTSDDVGEAIDSIVAEGLLDESTLSTEQLKSMLRKRFDNKQVADWFSGRWEILNECSILAYNPTTDKVEEKRPDRVMRCGDEIVVVDFKFGSHNNKYIDQVRSYMSLIKGMGHNNVRGYLWFVYSNIIEEVKYE